MIAENLEKIKNELSPNIKLVAVSKTKPEEEILEAYQKGHRDFGENKVQELVSKAENLPSDISWHMIGHLQSNKVKYIAPFISLIHSVDKEKLLRTINKEAQKVNRVLPCLLQFHIAQETSKFGLSYEEASEISKNKGEYPNVRIDGVMGMATFTDNVLQVRSEFKTLRSYFHKLKKDFFSDNMNFKEISMGMSDDYMIALEEGSTIIRVGSAIFGERNYSKP